MFIDTSSPERGYCCYWTSVLHNRIRNDQFPLKWMNFEELPLRHLILTHISFTFAYIWHTNDQFRSLRWVNDHSSYFAFAIRHTRWRMHITFRRLQRNPNCSTRHKLAICLIYMSHLWFNVSGQTGYLRLGIHLAAAIATQYIPKILSSYCL
jgi:hypothetical protein